MSDLWRRFFIILQPDHVRSGCYAPDHSVCLTSVIEQLLQAVRKNKEEAGPGSTLGVNASEQTAVEVSIDGL